MCSKHCTTEPEAVRLIHGELLLSAFVAVCGDCTKATNYLRAEIGPPVGSIAYPVARQVDTRQRAIAGGEDLVEHGNV